MNDFATPQMFHDRMPVKTLADTNPVLLETLGRWDLGKTILRKSVHFCGMVRTADGRVSVFLPRGAKLEIATAKLTMGALARYGRDASNRVFTKDGESGNSGLLAIVRHLSEDFRCNGLFRERFKRRSRNAGKPDWKRTLTREKFYPDQSGESFYSDIVTTRFFKSSETLLASIQAVVMSEIIKIHGWWIDGVTNRRQELRGVLPPSQKRQQWASLLDALLPTLYSTRSILLARWLGEYLRDSKASSDGEMVFGVEDFHTVWEAMLRNTLNDVDSGWNEKLPKAVYLRGGYESLDAPERGMLTDIILRVGQDFLIVDAKYYSANSEGGVPGWPDIAKQLFYEVALRSVVGEDARIRNFFVFPSGGESYYAEVKILERFTGIQVSAFGSVECVYVLMNDILSLYVGNSKSGIFCLRLR